MLSEAHAKLGRMLEHELPGIQYVVVNESGVVFEAALGVRDVATRAAMASDTLQMAYSMTKAFTAVAALALVDDGKLSLETPLSELFAEHPYGGDVTIRTLLAQTAGVPNPLPLAWFATEGTAFDRDAELARLLSKHARLVHPPGSKYAYSNLSYWLLEKAIEKAAGLDYASFLSVSLFEKLGITEAAATFSLPEPERMATGHSRRFSLETLVTRCLSPSAYWLEASGAWRRCARVVPFGRGYGGLFSSASALGRVLSDLLRAEPQLLSRAAKTSMFTEQRAGGKPIDRTLGWVTGRCGNARYFGKQGGGLGFHGNLRLYPDLGLASVLLANRTELAATPIDRRSNALDALFLPGAR